MAGTAAVLGGAPVLHRSKGVVRIEVALTTTAGGVVDATYIGEAWGRLVGFAYDGGLDASASITIKDSKTGATVFGPYVTGTEGTAVFFRPSVGIVDTAGVAVAAATTAPNTNRDIKVAGGLTITVSAGGNAETGKVALIIDEAGLGTKAVNV